ncbi:flagellar protein FliT [Clostridium sp. MB05]|uniref:flagellar protein FliT n=2 Tax=Clostridium TaxID=1485 RepID=UPI0039824A80
MMLEDLLEKYKEITKATLEYLKDDFKLEEVDKAMVERELLIKEIFKGDTLANAQIRELYLSKGLLELDNILHDSIEKSQKKIKLEIAELNKRKNASNAYESNKRINSFFSTKI